MTRSFLVAVDRDAELLREVHALYLRETRWIFSIEPSDELDAELLERIRERRGACERTAA